jgi:hypothetical protein
LEINLVKTLKLIFFYLNFLKKLINETLKYPEKALKKVQISKLGRNFQLFQKPLHNNTIKKLFNVLKSLLMSQKLQPRLSSQNTCRTQISSSPQKFTSQSVILPLKTSLLRRRERERDREKESNIMLLYY